MEGAHFLLNRLLSNHTGLSVSVEQEGKSGSTDVGVGNSGRSNPSVSDSKVLTTSTSNCTSHSKPADDDDIKVEATGAILADEMGLGKTLTSIAVLSAITRAGRGCKGLIVCPSSLVRVSL